MCINNINEELMPIFESITVLNVVEKMSEIIGHPLFVKDKIHVKIIKNYLNDDKIYVDRLERFLNTRPHKSIDDMTILEMVLIFSSSIIYNFEQFLNQNDKKQLVVKFLDILEYDEKGNLRLEKCNEALKYLLHTLHLYQSQNLTYQNNNLENIALLNQILDLLNNATNKLNTIDESAQDLFEKHESYYNKKKEYYKEKHFVEKEQSIKPGKEDDNNGDDIKNSYENYTNVFRKSMPISIAVNHFKIFTEKNSKNGKLFLTDKQFDIFIKKAFCGVSDLPILKLNKGSREKSLIINVFYDFYNFSYNNYYDIIQARDKYIRLLTDNFEGWQFEDVKSNFSKSPKKTIYQL